MRFGTWLCFAEHRCSLLATNDYDNPSCGRNVMDVLLAMIAVVGKDVAEGEGKLLGASRM